MVSAHDAIYTEEKHNMTKNSKALLAAPGGFSVHYTQQIKVLDRTNNILILAKTETVPAITY